jgi:hypothetical protein
VKARAHALSPALVRCAVAIALLALLLPSGDALGKEKGKPKGARKAAPTARAGKAGKAGKAGPRKSGKGKRTRKPKNGGKARPNPRVKVFDFTGLDLAGRLRTPQLIYFLDRAAQELELASLEKRSFVPEMIKSVDEDSL